MPDGYYSRKNYKDISLVFKIKLFGFHPKANYSYLNASAGINLAALIAGRKEPMEQRIIEQNAIIVTSRGRIIAGRALNI